MSYHVKRIVQQTEAMLKLRHDETLQETTPERLHECLGTVLMMECNENWTETKKRAAARSTSPPSIWSDGWYSAIF